jgi:predicted TIM-barrel enzyme
VSDVATARKATKLPILVGSGVTPDQLGSLFQYADALIVGSWIKTGGVWSNAVDAQRCREMVKARG